MGRNREARGAHAGVAGERENLLLGQEELLDAFSSQDHISLDREQVVQPFSVGLAWSGFQHPEKKVCVRMI